MKQVQETSLNAYFLHQEEFENLKEKIFRTLQAYIQVHEKPPTYNELHERMVDRFQDVSWRTQVQPRLTSDLVESDRVKRAGKRKCRVSGNLIQTWRPTEG